MLVLSRKENERIFIGDVVVTVTRINHDKVRLGIDAPPNVRILREEIAGSTRPEKNGGKAA